MGLGGFGFNSDGSSSMPSTGQRFCGTEEPLPSSPAWGVGSPSLVRPAQAPFLAARSQPTQRFKVPAAMPPPACGPEVLASLNSWAVPLLALDRAPTHQNSTLLHSFLEHLEQRPTSTKDLCMHLQLAVEVSDVKLQVLWMLSRLNRHKEKQESIKGKELKRQQHLQIHLKISWTSLRGGLLMIVE